MELKIEEGIPIPKMRLRKYPWEDMKVGDSFFVPDGNNNTIQTAASYAGKRHNRKYCTRQVNGGIRVWRIE